MIGDAHEVRYDLYCKTCKHKDVPESDPEGKCWDCLEEPVAVDSRKPVNYEKAE